MRPGWGCGTRETINGGVFMKDVRLEHKNGEWRLVEKNTNRIVARDRSEVKCMEFLVNNEEYCYDPFRKDVHYAL